MSLPKQFPLTSIVFVHTVEVDENQNCVATNIFQNSVVFLLSTEDTLLKQQECQ